MSKGDDRDSDTRAGAGAHKLFLKTACAAAMADASNAAVGAPPVALFPEAYGSPPLKTVATEAVDRLVERQTLGEAAGQAPNAPKPIATLAPKAFQQPALIADRAAGLRLLVSMASGHKDRRLHVLRPAAPFDIPGAPLHQPEMSLASRSQSFALKTPEGLEWFHSGRADVDSSGNRGGEKRRALLGRHSLLRTAIPRAGAWAAQLPLHAVACSLTLLDGGSIRAEVVTLLPPGDEWLELALSCMGKGGELERSNLMRNQRIEAAEIAASMASAYDSPTSGAMGSALTITQQPALRRRLLNLFAPWMAEPPDAEAADDESGECSICFSVRHLDTGQLPRLKCATCKNSFHAACLFKWFHARNRDERAGGNRCPLCQTTDPFE